MQAQYQTLLTNQQQAQQKYQAAMSRIMKAHKLEGEAGVGWSADDNGNLVKRVVPGSPSADITPPTTSTPSKTESKTETTKKK